MDPTQIDLPFVHLDDEEFELVIFEMNQGFWYWLFRNVIL